MPGNCSYCHLSGHNITRCRHPNIDIEYNRIKMLYLDKTRRCPDIICASNRFIDDVCRRFGARDLKAITARYIGSQTRVQKKRLAQNIWDYFFVMISPLEVPERLPTIPDEIPSYAQDLVDESFVDDSVVDESFVDDSVVDDSVVDDSVVDDSVVDESGVVDDSWYIDRTPSFHQRPSTRPRPSPYGYIYPEDEFMDEYMNLVHRNLVPRNLNHEFDRASVKKYHIAPSISVTETSEELEKCEDCSICYETTKLSNTVTINCGHKFCGSCVKRTLEMHTNIYNSPSCALCRAPMRNFVAKNPDIYNLVVEHCIL